MYFFNFKFSTWTFFPVLDLETHPINYLNQPRLVSIENQLKFTYHNAVKDQREYFFFNFICEIILKKFNHFLIVIDHSQPSEGTSNEHAELELYQGRL